MWDVRCEKWDVVYNVLEYSCMHFLLEARTTQSLQVRFVYASSRKRIFFLDFLFRLLLSLHPRSVTHLSRKTEGMAL